MILCNLLKCELINIVVVVVVVVVVTMGQKMNTINTTIKRFFHGEFWTFKVNSVLPTFICKSLIALEGSVFIP